MSKFLEKLPHWPIKGWPVINGIIQSVIFIVVCTILTGCQTTRDVYNDPERARSSQASKEECKDPVALPDKALTEEEVLVYWGVDRMELSDCKAKNKVLVKTNTVLERRK
jgi:hypothetical protein